MDETSFEGCVVIFHNVLEWYNPGQSILCQFSMKDKACLDKQGSDCYVGIFHVGWDSLSASITRKSFSLTESVSDRSFQVEFLDPELPDSNPDEFYQFCFYNIKSEVVYGASCPFQICNRASEPFVVCGGNPSIPSSNKKTTADASTDASTKSMTLWMEENQIEISDDIDEDFDTVMVVKKTPNIEESLSKVKLEHEILLKTNETMQSESAKSASEINQLCHDIEMKDRRAAILEESIKESDKVIKHLNTQMKDMKEGIVREYEGKIKDITTEIEKLESDRAKAHLENNLLKTEMKEKEQKMTNEIAHLKNALEVEKNSCKLLEDEHRNVLEKFGQIKDAHGKGVEEVKEIEAKLIETASHLKVERQKNACLHGELDNLSEAVEILKKELKTKEAAFLKREESLKEEVVTITNQLQLLQDQNGQFCDTIDHLNEREGNQHIVHTNLVAELKNKITDLLADLQETCTVKEKEISLLSNQLEKQTDHINECNSHVESLELQLEENKTENLRINYASECLNEESQKVMEDLRSKVEEQQEQLELKQEIKPTTMSKAEGSYYALQVAYSFIQKQLKQFKSENEELRKLVQPNLQDGDGASLLLKENDDLKLRLQFAKQVFEEKFKESQQLKSELSSIKKKSPGQESNNVQVNNDQQLKEEKDHLESEIVVLKEELKKKEEDEFALLLKIDEEKDKVKKYDDNFKLLREENMLLKTQVSALLEGGTTATIRRKFDPQTPEVIYQPPSSFGKPEIAYPPSMNKMDRDRQNAAAAAWLPSKAKQAHPNNPPSNQVIPNRNQSNPTATAPPMHQHPPMASLTLQGRGKVGRKHQQAPTFQCPICQFDFPIGYSEASASAHVNGHFRE